jgi:hypothetical protein
MRVSPRELRGIRAEGLLTRFAMLGPVAFVSVEIPAGGSAGTGIEKPTENPAWGIILSGSAGLHGPDEQVFTRGTAFHVPGGPPQHWFTASGRTVIAGFAPLTREIDTSDAGIRAMGFEPVARMAAPAPPPAVISPVGGGSLFKSRGSIEAEIAPMGDWVFTRTTYGPLSGYTSGWCDLPHWGMVLSGDLALRFEDTVELLSAGDVYYCPAGPPGHQFQVADAATTIDYTPIADLFGSGRKAEWRSAAARRMGDGEFSIARAVRRPRSKTLGEPSAVADLPETPSAGRRAARSPALRPGGRSGVQWVRRAPHPAVDAHIE